MMVQPHSHNKFLVCLCLALLTACQALLGPSLTISNPAPVPAEVAVQEIPLSGPASGRRAEISGMAWYGDTLILLPQFPDRFGAEQNGAVFALRKSILLDYVENNLTSPVEPETIPFQDGGISQTIKNFEGFESIAFDGEKVYLTIEASPKQMKGYVISGSMDLNGSGVTLNPATLTEIPMQADLANISDESIILFEDKIFTLYEANGVRVNPTPVAHLFDRSLQFLGVRSLPNLEYRITDAAPPDPEGYFWAINAYFPPDQWKLKPDQDMLAERYGLGETHLDNITVERLVLFQVEGSEIRLVDVPPVQLHLEGDVAPRNWEALALLNQQGFLIATDKFPRTILGFVPFEFDR